MMESLLNETSLSPTKQIKNSRRKTHYQHQQQHQHQAAARLPNILRQSSCGAIHPKYAPPPHVQLEMVHAVAGGVFLNHFPKQYSLSSNLLPILPTYYQHHHQKINQQHLHQHQQPPLLPLPVISKPTFRSLRPPPLTRGHSLSAPLPRSHSLSSAVSKKQTNKLTKLNSGTTTSKRSTNPKKDLVSESKAATTKGLKKGSSLVENDQHVVPAKGVKPDPGSVPKENAPRVLQVANHKCEVADEKKKYLTAASIFSLSPESPPPSSLPLPKFPLRKLQQSELNCNAEAAAAEVDTGATDNLRRLLRLR